MPQFPKLPGVNYDCVLSPCGTYRYKLTRTWKCPRALMPIVMLNPSTADGLTDDRTIRKCMEFARRHDHAGITVYNLFALRSTDPGNLQMAHDPVGPENDFHLKGIRGPRVLVAWGSHPFAAPRIRHVLNHVLDGLQLMCLGINDNGTPKHPLYIPNETQFTHYHNPETT